MKIPTIIAKFKEKICKKSLKMTEKLYLNYKKTFLMIEYKSDARMRSYFKEDVLYEEIS